MQNILPLLPAIMVTYAVGARASARRRPKHPNEGVKASPHIEEAGAVSCAEDEPKANADTSANNVALNADIRGGYFVSQGGCQYSGGCKFLKSQVLP